MTIGSCPADIRSNLLPSNHLLSSLQSTAAPQPHKDKEFSQKLEELIAELQIRPRTPIDRKDWRGSYIACQLQPLINAGVGNWSRGCHVKQRSNDPDST